MGGGDYGTHVKAHNFTSPSYPSGGFQLREDTEGGNLQLRSPNGTKYVEMDISDNNEFRMYFDGGSGLDFPFLYNFGTKTLTVTGALDGFIKSKHTIGSSSECTYKTIESWAAAQLGVSWAFVISSYGYPSDAPVQTEGLLRVETDSSAARKIVTFIPYNLSIDEYRREMFNGGWRAGWQSRQAASGYVIGAAVANSTIQTVTLGFQPSAVLCTGSPVHHAYASTPIPDVRNSLIITNDTAKILVCGCVTVSGNSISDDYADVTITRTSTGFTVQAANKTYHQGPVIDYIAFK